MHAGTGLRRSRRILPNLTPDANFACHADDQGAWDPSEVRVTGQPVCSRNMRSGMREIFLASAVRLAFGAALVLPVAAQAQTGQIAGNIDGAAFGLPLGTPEPEEAGFFVRQYAGRGFTELNMDLIAIREGESGLEGVMIGLSFDSDGDLDLSDFTADMLFEAEFALIEDWPVDQMDPSSIWLADMDSADDFDVAIALDDDSQIVRGQFASSRFCLHQVDDLGYTPVLDGGDSVCKAAELEFSASSDGADTSAPGGGPVEVEVLGRMKGTVGTDAFEWLTITRNGGQGTASFAQTQDGTLRLRVQGHSPESENFLYQDVMSINIWAHGDIPENTPIPAEVMFALEGTSGLPRVFYTSDEGAGEAQAVIRSITLEDARPEIELDVSGTLCRVEGFTPIDGDCRMFNVTGRSELLDDGDLF